MLQKIITGILFAILTGAVAKGIIQATGLDLWVARMIRATLDSQYLSAIGWALSGTIGVAALVLWIGLRLDQKIYDWWSPQPALGSLHRGQPVLKLDRDQKNNRTDAVLAIQLYNSNDRLVAYRGELRTTVNGRDLEAPITVNGYVNAKAETSLFVNMDDIPNLIEGNVLSIDARLRYNVFYYFPENEARKRRTSKWMQWIGKYPASGMEPWKQLVDPTYVRFSDEVEE